MELDDVGIEKASPLRANGPDVVRTTASAFGTMNHREPPLEAEVRFPKEAWCILLPGDPRRLLESYGKAVSHRRGSS